MDDVDDIFDLYRQGKISDKELEKKLSWKEYKKRMDDEQEELQQKLHKEFQEKEEELDRLAKMNAKFKERYEKAKKRSVRTAQNHLNRVFLGLDKNRIPIHPRYKKNMFQNYPLPKSVTDQFEESYEAFCDKHNINDLQKDTPP